MGSKICIGDEIKITYGIPPVIDVGIVYEKNSKRWVRFECSTPKDISLKDLKKCGVEYEHKQKYLNRNIKELTL